jgi:Mg2+ and Co2+ transporter CorA
MHLLRLSGHMYVMCKELYRLNKKIKGLHDDVVKFTHKYRSATTADDQHKYHKKTQKYAHKYQETMEHRRKLLARMHSFNAGFARELQKEAHTK